MELCLSQKLLQNACPVIGVSWRNSGFWEKWPSVVCLRENEHPSIAHPTQEKFQLWFQQPLWPWATQWLGALSKLLVDVTEARTWNMLVQGPSPLPLHYVLRRTLCPSPFQSESYSYITSACTQEGDTGLTAWSPLLRQAQPRSAPADLRVRSKLNWDPQGHLHLTMSEK